MYFLTWPSKRPPTWPSWFFARCKLCRLRSGWSCDTWVQEGKKDGKSQGWKTDNTIWRVFASLFLRHCDSAIMTCRCTALQMMALLKDAWAVVKTSANRLKMSLKPFLISKASAEALPAESSQSFLSSDYPRGWWHQSSWSLILSSCCAFNTWSKHLRPWNSGLQFLMQIYLSAFQINLTQ